MLELLLLCALVQDEATVSGPQVVLEGLDGSERQRALDGTSVSDLRESEAVFVRFAQLGRDPSDSTPLDRTQVVSCSLIGGDRLYGRVVSGDGDDLTLLSTVGTAMTLSVDALLKLEFPGRLDSNQSGSLEAPESGDRLYWIRRDGLDRIDGTLEAFEPEGVSFDSVLGTQSFPWDEVAALFIEPLGELEELDAEGDALPVVCDLRDGGRLSGLLLDLSPQALRLRWQAGGEFEIDVAAVEELTLAGAGLQFLSELDPIEVDEGSPFDDDLGLRWPHQRDRSVTGRALQVGGRVWRRGIGVHAPSRLTWDLGGSWSELRTSVGVDDEVLDLPHRGSVDFRIYVDGKLVWESGVLRGGEGLRQVPAIDLSGAQRLTLEAGMASQSFIADRADWLRPLLVR